MVANVLGLLILAALVVLLGWLATRAWGSRHLWIKWPGAILAGLLTLVLALVTGLAVKGFVQMSSPRNPPVPAIKVAATPAQIERGQHIASVVCADCHSLTGEPPLSGGKNLAEDTGIPLGSIYGANLTPGGDLANWSDGEIVRAIRQLTAKDGRPLLMPSDGLRYLTDQDAEAVVAFLRSQPAVQKQTPPTQPSILLAILVGAGVYDVSTPKVQAPPVQPQGPTPEMGQYVVNLIGCQGCHGADLNGGKPPSPQGPSLRLVGNWTKDDFFKAMRTGVDPTGHKIQPPMPWQSIGKLDDTELAGLYEYLHNLPPVKQ